MQKGYPILCVSLGVSIAVEPRLATHSTIPFLHEVSITLILDRLHCAAQRVVLLMARDFCWGNLFSLDEADGSHAGV